VFKVQGSGSRFKVQGSRIQDQVSRIKHPESRNQDPGSADTDTGFRINALRVNEPFYATVGFSVQYSVFTFSVQQKRFCVMTLGQLRSSSATEGGQAGAADSEYDFLRIINFDGVSTL
jgi:hypothetical protein